MVYIITIHIDNLQSQSNDPKTVAVFAPLDCNTVSVGDSRGMSVQVISGMYYTNFRWLWAKVFHCLNCNWKKKKTKNLVVWSFLAK